jgi:D-glycero-D-manno-heptose 1,7-bisphosphate phosphatase
VNFPPTPILDRDPTDLPYFQKGVVVFDRDDTLIEDAGQHADPNKLVFLPGARETINLLNTLDYGVAVASNQSGLESEKFSLSDLNTFSEELKRQIASEYPAVIHLMVFCPHLAISECLCRKPKTGLLHTIEASGLGKVILFVGNSESDELAAKLFKVEYIDVNTNEFPSRIMEWAKGNELR